MADKSDFTADLNYEWLQPQPPKGPTERINWQFSDSDPYASLRETMDADEWPVAHIRAKIEAMDGKPQGRSRDALTQQFIDQFSNKQRLLKTLQSLPEAEKLFYSYFLLHYLLINNHTQPISLDRMFPEFKSNSHVVNDILDRGLAMQNRYDEYLFPRVMLRNLPQLEIQINAAPVPKTFIPAHTPHLLAIQLQQLLATVQQETLELRPQLMWKSPSIYNSWRRDLVWPVYPEAARMLEDARDYSGVLELVPPELLLNETAVNLLAEKLTIPPHIVDFLYRGLILAGVVYSGSPAQTLDRLVSQWITLPAGRQAAILFQQYTKMGDWAAWWQNWAQGEVTVGWDYDSYHYGAVVGNSMRLTITMLRRIILDTLSVVPHGIWISTKTLTNWLGKIFPSQKSQQYQTILQLNSAKGTWKGFIEQAVLATLTGPLHWLGFADLAPDADTPEAFRLHHLQDVYWQKEHAIPSSSNTPFSSENLMVDGDELILHLPAPSDVLAFVQNWASLKHFSGDHLTYELSVPLLHGSFEMGETAESLSTGWESLVGFPAPSRLCEWWTSWDARYGHIRLYTHQSALITRDTLTMTEVQTAIPAIQPGIRGLIAPNFALLDDSLVDDIISNLKRQGYMPKED